MRRPAEDLPTLREKPARNADAPASERAPTSDDAPESQPRPRVLGRYRLLFEIARGGMGSVHAAVMRGEGGVDRTFAIKLLHRDGRGSDELEAFVQEARLTANISHPNVLETFELGMHRGEPFIVMPLVRGVTLSKFLERLAEKGRRIPTDLALWIAAQVAAGLHAAHEVKSSDGQSLHVVHRDVSPQNVMLAYDGQVLLLDFGVAKLFEAARATASGVIKGKFGYMSPEQLRGEMVDRRTDIFALGVVLHEMVTGRALYGELAPAVAALRITTETPPLLASANPEAPAELQRIVSKAMSKDRDARYDSALELFEDLRGLTKSRGSSTDASELTQLLTEAFSAERDTFETRMRASLAASEADRASQAMTVLPAPASVDAAAPRVRSSTAVLIAIVAVLLGVGASLAWALGSSKSEPRAEATQKSALSSGAPIAEASAVAPATAAVTAEAPASSASSEAPATSSARPRATARSSVAGSSAKSAATITAVPTATGSVKGEPFRHW